MGESDLPLKETSGVLRWRVLLGALLIGGLVGLCYLDYHTVLPGIWLMPLAILIALLASQELLGLLAAGELNPSAGVVYGGNVLIVVANFVPMLAGRYENSYWGYFAFVLTVLVAFGCEILSYTKPGGSIRRLALTLFAFTYVGLLLTSVCQLRYVQGPKFGVMVLVSLIVTVKMGDIGAYTVGRLVGRTKLAPILSPGKTVEGALGALCFATIGAYLVFHLMFPLVAAEEFRLPWWAGLLFGLTVGTAGVVGDLAESLIKRDMGKKDSSSWMPGFGGVLDIVDSILFAAPVAYVVWVVLIGHATSSG